MLIVLVLLWVSWILAVALPSIWLRLGFSMASLGFGSLFLLIEGESAVEGVVGFCFFCGVFGVAGVWTWVDYQRVS